MSKAADLANLIGNINAGGGGVNRNVIINGAMNVAQRGTSSTGLGGNADSYHTVDRFKLLAEGSNSGRLTMTQDSSAPVGFANSLKLACTTADTSIAAAELLTLSQMIEGQNLQHFAKGTSSAKPYAVSFYVKGNASATYVCELFDNSNSRHVCKTFSVTTDFTRVELSFPADTTGTISDNNSEGLRLQIFLHAGSNFTSGTLPATWASKTNTNRAAGISSFFDSTDRTFFITGVQLEVGQNPTEFEHEPHERTEMKCYRYYYKSTTYPLSMANAHTTGYTFRQERTQQHSMPVKMRNSPTFTAVESAKSLSSGTVLLTGSTDFINIVPTAHSGDLPSAEYWYGGYTADAEL